MVADVVAVASDDTNVKDTTADSFNKFNRYLFYNDYETSYTTYIKHARWHRCLRSDGLRVGGKRSTRRKHV